jgi:transcriptional regulator with XRE-family HTH domain
LTVQFGQAVRLRRSQLALAQEQVAEAADLDRSYYADIEAGRRNPTLEVLAKIAAALDTRLSALLMDL